MRTTLTVDDDVLLAARKLADASGKSVGKALSDLARRGLSSSMTGRRRGGIQLLPTKDGATGATLEEVNRLRDEA